MEVSLCKATVTPDMVGKLCLIVVTEEGARDLRKVGYGEMLACKVYAKYDRVSIEYFNTYWACCQLVSDNYGGDDRDDWDSKEKVSEQIKIKCRFVDGWIHYHNQKTGEKALNLRTKSVSFDTPWEEVKVYLDDAFPKMADIIGLSADEMVTEAKARMKSRRRVCAGCGKKAVHKHHLFEQTKLNRELYGDLLDDERNIMHLCDDCHEWKPVEHISEADFSARLRIEARSKTGKL